MPSRKDATETQDESKYVDLVTDGMKTVNVYVTGEGSQMAIHEGKEDLTADEKSRGDTVLARKVTDHIKRDKEYFIAKECPKGYLSGFLGTICFSEVPILNENIMDCTESQVVVNGEVQAERTRDVSPLKIEEAENPPVEEQDDTDLQYTDMLSEQSESDDDVSLVPGDCDDGVAFNAEDESHYITTHEIQLSEFSDHDVDYDIDQGWDDNHVYSFIDYAAFDSDVTMPGKEERLKSNQGQANSGAAVSTTLEVDLRDGDKCAISDESLSKNQKNVGGPIHLSIKTTSQAINEPSNFYENEHILYHAKHAADMSRYIFRADANGEKLCDSAKCFIAAPGRLHISSKLKGKDLNEYSSGTSSAVSELDDADKEVRNLTARAFKSLAYPYFDPFNFSTSSESSASELGVNRWSTFVDLKYGNLNMSKAREPNRVSNKSSTSSSEFTNPKEKMGHKGLTLTTKPPSNKLFALKGALSGPYNASSAAKKFELMGKFGQRHSGVITLTETLNFRCNVTSGLPGSDRRSKFAQKSTGSRSIDTVTNTLPSGQESEASKQPCNPGETMEGTHKKAIFASSLLKNVISKKMQFEQERKMERGEIREPHTQPPCFIKQETEMTHRERDRATPKASKDFQRRSSKYSEANSDLTIVCVDELGDLVDTSSSDAKFDGRRQDLASGTHLVATHEVGFDAKKEAIDAPKSTLLRSQNSAFRSWRDGELMFQTELKNEKTLKEKPSSSPQSQEKMDLYTDSRNGKLTKMSHLFVPSIQLLSNDDVSKKVPTVNNSTRAHADKRGMALCTNNTLYVADPRNVVAPKSPEIKISLRSIKENKGDQFNVSKLVPPNIASNSVNLLKPGEESRCQALAAALKAESSDKIPHFTVRDIRDHKGKLQTPIHQVRDVRKLVKSSYHFVSLENNATAGDPQSDQKLSKQGTYRKPASLSPIIIKCQSVNTNGNGKQSGNLIENSKRTPNEDSFDVDRSLPQQEGDKNDLQQPKGTVPSDNSKQVKGDSSEEPIGLPIETITVTKKREKTPDMAEKIKPESNISNMAALEKLQAAVKTMEQLYVFDRNEWKRKSEPHSELSDSHVLPLISSEEYGPEVPMATMTTPIKDKLTQENCFKHSDKALHETMPTKHQKEPPNTYYIPISRDVSKPFTLQAGTPEVTKNVIKVSSKASGNSKSNGQKVSLQPPASTQSAYCKGFSSVSPKLTVSGKITQPLRNAEERESGRVGERPVQFSRALAEPQNYLTIPVKTQVASAKQGVTSSGEGREKTAVYTFTGTRSQNRNASPPGLAGARMQDETGQSPQKRATVIMETRAQDTPSSTIFHHVPMGLAPAQPQVYCFSPGIAPHAMPQVDHFQHTQRKMLFDPTTGNYYLVDTPIQPVTRRLFDPETGQYVDVPISQQPMSPLPISMPTMPMPMSPLAMSSGSYGPTYMIYPGFMPTVPATPTLIPARMPSQPSMQSEQEDSGDKGRSSQPDYMESPYYLATGSGKSPQAGGSAMGQVNTRPGLQGFSNGKQPVISISSQQGPRIIAPASFDGTTMSFVLEHR
ncbi:hypothetical protein UPYG_G00240610 [Umbra pygmaea]|uniref:DUF4585 domain-containing protein n=1 Tax=Umbra pygmaea TaxID=75934 RepID=A0ABD0WFD2_UMBPY